MIQLLNYEIQTKHQMLKPYFKIYKKNAATNWKIKDAEGDLDLLIASGKLENWSTAKGLDSFFILKTTDTVGNVID